MATLLLLSEKWRGKSPDPKAVVGNYIFFHGKVMREFDYILTDIPDIKKECNMYKIKVELVKEKHRPKPRIKKEFEER